MTKIDLKVQFKDFYRASATKCVEVEVPTFRYLMIDGIGDPNKSTSYAQAIEALFAVSYTAKFMIKKGPQQIDYAVMPLEGLWWADDMSVYQSGDKSQWKWTMMILQPSFVEASLLQVAIADVQKKKQLPALPLLRIEDWREGRSAQILHVGPFTEEGPTIQRLHDFIESQGSSRTGKHHEIYLSDIRKATPSNWKTILRQPIQ